MLHVLLYLFMGLRRCFLRLPVTLQAHLHGQQRDHDSFEDKKTIFDEAVTVDGVVQLSDSDDTKDVMFVLLSR